MSARRIFRHPLPTYPVPSCGTSLLPMPRFIPTQHQFRNPHYLLPFLSQCTGYVVYFISAHGSTIGTFESSDIDSETAFAVVQTGGGESIGCKFMAGGEALMMDLFSTNIVYSFQQLLGMFGDRMSPFYRDLHYATSDEQEVEGAYTYEVFPNKLLSYTAEDIGRIYAGVFCYDPAARDLPAGTPAFQRMDDFDTLFDPVKMEGGISLFELLNLFPKKIAELSVTNPFYRPLVGRTPIYVVSSCATVARDLPSATLNALVKASAATSHYSVLRPGQASLFSTARMIRPERYSRFVTGNSIKIPRNWRNTKRSRRIHKRLFGVEPLRVTTKNRKRNRTAAGAATGGAGTGGAGTGGENYSPLPNYESP